MSRSYRKNLVFGWVTRDKDAKKRFNRKIRRTTDFDDIPSGMSYKKFNESWEIDDGKWRVSYEDFKNWHYVNNKMSEEEAKAYFKKHFWSK